MAEATAGVSLRLYGLGSIGQSSHEHSSQPFSSRAASGERPCSIADLILWQRSQSGLSVISATHSWGYVPTRSPQTIGSTGPNQLAFYVISWIRRPVRGRGGTTNL